MKKSLVLILCSMTLSTIAGAQQMRSSLGREALELAQDIRQEEQYLSQSQKAEIRRLLHEVRGVLFGTDDRPATTYTCTSRDNDGRAPYVMATRTGIQVTRIPGETFASDADCQYMLKTISYLRGNAFLCASRDQDGRSPWTIASLRGTQLQRLQGVSYNSKESCQIGLRGLLIQGSVATTCVSRDNDGRAPFVAAEIDLQNLSIRKGNESFNSMASCEQFLGVNN